MEENPTVQDDNFNEHSTQNTTQTPMPSPMSDIQIQNKNSNQPHIIEDDENNPSPIRHPNPLIRINSHNLISQHALNMFTITSLLNTKNIHIPRKLTISPEDNTPMEYYAFAGVVDPDSGQTLKKYEEIIKRPALTRKCTKAINNSDSSLLLFL